MRNFDVAIIEDNVSDRDTLINNLMKYGSLHDCGFQISDYASGEAFLRERNRNFDIVFMDIQLLGIDGIETARRFRQHHPVTILILVTNTEHYAIRGYDVNANDFILKPVRYVSFENKLTKAIAASVAAASEEKIAVNLKEETRLIPLKNIYYIEIAQHELIYHTTMGNITAYGSLNKIESAIQNSSFARCCSWYLVNLNHVEGIYNDEIKLYTGELLHISRGKRKSFLEALLRHCTGVIK